MRNAWVLILLLCLLITQSLSIGETAFNGQIYTGTTNNWQEYSTKNGIYVDVDFEDLELRKPPLVLTSI